jgi:WD40 repeat protein
MVGCKAREPDEAHTSSPAISPVSGRPGVLATLPDEATAAGYEFLFSERGGGVAYVSVEKYKFRVVHNGRIGDSYEAVGTVALSPDGLRCAHGALAEGKWRMVVDGRGGPSFGAVEAPVFSPDGLHLAYRAKVGESWHLVVDTTVNGGTPTQYMKHEFCAGSSRIVFVDDADERGWGRLVVSDLAFKSQTIVDARVSSVALNADRSRVAAVAVGDGRQRVVTCSLDRPHRVRRGRRYDAVHTLVFGPDGSSLAYLAERSGALLVVLDDREERVQPGDVMVELPVVRPDKSGVGGIVVSNGSVLLRQFFVAGGEGEGAYQGIEGLTYASDGRSHVYAAEKGGSFFVVANGKEGPPFDRVVSPMFSPDGKYLVYRARKDGKRFVVIADTDGKTIRRLAAYEQVFPVRFTADGKSIAYGVKDGRRLAWKVEAL